MQVKATLLTGSNKATVFSNDIINVNYAICCTPPLI